MLGRGGREETGPKEKKDGGWGSERDDGSSLVRDVNLCIHSGGSTLSISVSIQAVVLRTLYMTSTGKAMMRTRTVEQSTPLSPARVNILRKKCWKHTP